MSDNPPLAEIIGLDYRKPHKYPSSPPPDEILAFKCAACGEWVRDDEDSECSVAWNPPTPTVDDLLDWLAERSTEVTITVANWMGPARVTVYPGRLTQATHVHGPTLADALEQAVRLVHDQTGG